MSFYNSRYYKSSQKEQARHEGEHYASCKYEARIAELEEQLSEAEEVAREKHNETVRKKWENDQ